MVNRRHRTSPLGIASGNRKPIPAANPLGQYPTRVYLAHQIYDHYFPYLNAKSFVVDAGCGPGAFLTALPSYVPAIGVDIDARMCQLARANTGREILHGDFCTIPLDVAPTLIIGNPPFNTDVIDGFLDRSYELLPEGGNVAFVLPAYAFQTASRVARYGDRWSLRQDMMPRNVFTGLSLPIVFAIFTKDHHRKLIGFVFYREVADVQQLPQPYREALDATSGPVWRHVVDLALVRLGGEADLGAIYAEVEGRRPTRTKFWREKIRQVLRRYSDRFHCTGRGRYARRHDNVLQAAA
ncbi:hypothetical protein RHDC4_03085 [Rhodocyclaceae bacterium]|nr:hypothetical protein RHDC4_03085 [Rhodocyclaceae bacterium]